MSKRSVKELFDEITSLDRIDLKILLDWYEAKLGVPEERSVRPPAVVDDNVFVRDTTLLSPETLLRIGYRWSKNFARIGNLPLTSLSLFWIVFPKRFMNSIRKMIRLRSGENIWKLD